MCVRVCVQGSCFYSFSCINFLEVAPGISCGLDQDIWLEDVEFIGQFTHCTLRCHLILPTHRQEPEAWANVPSLRSAPRVSHLFLGPLFLWTGPLVINHPFWRFPIWPRKSLCLSTVSISELRCGSICVAVHGTIISRYQPWLGPDASLQTPYLECLQQNSVIAHRDETDGFHLHEYSV